MNRYVLLKNISEKFSLRNMSRVQCLEVAVYNLQFDSYLLLISYIKSVGNCLTFFLTSTFNLLVSKSYNSAKSLSHRTFYFRINGILPEICSLGYHFLFCITHHSTILFFKLGLKCALGHSLFKQSIKFSL